MVEILTSDIPLNVNSSGSSPSATLDQNCHNYKTNWERTFRFRKERKVESKVLGGPWTWICGGVSGWDGWQEMG